LKTAGEEYYSQLMEERKLRHSLESQIGEAEKLLRYARDALNPAVSPVTRKMLEDFLDGVVERQSPDCEHAWDYETKLCSKCGKRAQRLEIDVGSMKVSEF
jgi:hypothetical protein